ncbi:unnamed protein product [Protopolystoma xenopodis]|uniref:Uncharacterized protein n=1 Tax=Protopolystoma xenopodis TaxID=117903 RepID=A0A3S5A0V9_9PLAT|nr:unnamed protein product [Protopolystoma xenopodis]
MADRLSSFAPYASSSADFSSNDFQVGQTSGLSGQRTSYGQGVSSLIEPSVEASVRWPSALCSSPVQWSNCGGRINSLNAGYSSSSTSSVCALGKTEHVLGPRALTKSLSVCSSANSSSSECCNLSRPLVTTAPSFRNALNASSDGNLVGGVNQAISTTSTSQAYSFSKKGQADLVG